MNNAARRALLILEEVGRAQRPLGAAEISRKLGVPTATAFRDLDALERTGFAARYQASSRYVLGTGAKRLRQTLFVRFPIREICLPYLRQLSFASGETTALTVPLGWFSVQIAAVPGTQEVINAPALGRVQLLSDGSASRSILAFQPERTLEGLVDWTGRRSITLPSGLAEDLAAIRQSHYALDPLGASEGKAAISFPLLSRGRAVAALSIDGPVMDVARQGVIETLPHWREMLAEIGALIKKFPALCCNPFDHIDPEEIALDDIVG